jgi:hypothetical protein
MFPHEIEAFWNRLAKEEEVEVVSVSHAETGWVSDSNREKHWNNTHLRQFEPDEVSKKYRAEKNSGVSCFTHSKYKRDYSIPFTDIAKSPLLHIGEVDVALSEQVESIKCMQQEANTHKKFGSIDLTQEEKMDIIKEAGLDAGSTKEELLQIYRQIFLEEYKE